MGWRHHPRLGQCSGMTPEPRVRIAAGQAWRQEEARRNRASLSWCRDWGALFRRTRCYSSSADEAEAVLVCAARSEEVQLVDHMVVTTGEGSIDPGPLEDRQFEGSFHELPALPVAHEIHVAFREPHRK